MECALGDRPLGSPVRERRAEARDARRVGRITNPTVWLVLQTMVWLAVVGWGAADSVTTTRLAGAYVCTSCQQATPLSFGSEY